MGNVWESWAPGNQEHGNGFPSVDPKHLNWFTSSSIPYVGRCLMLLMRILLSSTKCEYATISKSLKHLKFLGVTTPTSKCPQNFLQTMDLLNPESILTVLEWPILSKAFLQLYVSAKKMHKIFPRSPPSFREHFLQLVYQSNSLGNVMCQFQTDGSRWLHSYTILKFWTYQFWEIWVPEPTNSVSVGTKNITIHQSWTKKSSNF